MGVEFVGYEIAADTDGDTNVTVDVPSDVVDGDLLILVRGNVNGSTLSAPTDFTKWPDLGGLAPAGFNATMDVDYRVASSEPSDYTVAVQTRCAALLFAVRGLDAPDDPVVDADNDNGDDYLSQASTSMPINLALNDLPDLSIPQPIIYIGYAQTTTTAGGGDPDRFAQGTGAITTGTATGSQVIDARIEVNTTAHLHALYTVYIEPENKVSRANDEIDFSNVTGDDWPGSGVTFFMRLFGAALTSTDTSSDAWAWVG